jgi:hypothetical protein
MSEHLDAFVASIRDTTTDAAVLMTIKQALLHPRIDFYAALLHNARVELLCPGGADDASIAANGPALWQLLRVATYGVYADVAQLPAEARGLVDSSATLQRKLRTLTLLSLAAESKRIAYAPLYSALGIAAGQRRALEDAVIEATSTGLLSCTLDPSAGVVIVHAAAARDVALSELAAVEAQLRAWAARCATVDGQLQALKTDSSAATAETQQRGADVRVAQGAAWPAALGAVDPACRAIHEAYRKQVEAISRRADSAAGAGAGGGRRMMM